jgi:hypothetical protein
MSSQTEALISLVCAVVVINDDFCIEFLSAAYKKVRLGGIQGPPGIS